ncbi:protein kinase domain-containing protein [Cyanobium sp. ATX-6F1]|uniref:protein kinase domain-containing protein n=1 Tax=Cyanobium sp. ATX-6F1 TaxID=3137388 RepID=UPI0039BE72B9
MSGALIGDRYLLEEQLSRSAQGVLWRASDQLAGEAPMVLRQLAPGQDQQRFRELWGRLQGVLHPQVPRFGGVIQDGASLWLVREWQGGPTYQELLEARRERQLVFGSGEVLLLLRQLLPVLAVLHSQQLLHGDLTPANLLRRDRDGLPVLLDFGLVRGWRPPPPSQPVCWGPPRLRAAGAGAWGAGPALDGPLQPGGGGAGVAQWPGARRAARSGHPGLAVARWIGARAGLSGGPDAPAGERALRALRLGGGGPAGPAATAHAREHRARGPGRPHRGAGAPERPAHSASGSAIDVA